MLPKYVDPDTIAEELAVKKALYAEAQRKLDGKLTEADIAEIQAGLSHRPVIFALGRQYQDMLQFKSLLEAFDTYGYIYMSKWERDCDCAEWTVRFKFNSLEECWATIEDSYNGAEGPVAWNLLNPEEWECVTEGTRDRVLEAFENGNSAPYFL